MNKLVVIYTMEGCHFCQKMKQSLDEDDIVYYELDIHENPEEYKLFVEATENNYVPSFMIVDIDEKPVNTKLFAPDRDYNDISEGVKIIKDALLR